MPRGWSVTISIKTKLAVVKLPMHRLLADAQAQQQRMGIADVIALSQAKQNDQIIINQIRSTRSTFTLTVSDLDMLKNNGVSDAVIAEMQASRSVAGPTRVVQPHGHRGTDAGHRAPGPVLLGLSTATPDCCRWRLPSVVNPLIEDKKPPRCNEAALSP